MYRFYGRSGCGGGLGAALLCSGVFLLSIAFLPAACWLFLIGLAMALEGFFLIRRRHCRF